jgi:hypothetical protein
LTESLFKLSVIKTPVVDRSTGLNHRALQKYCFTIDTADVHFESAWRAGADADIERHFDKVKTTIETAGITLRIEK